MSPHHSMCLISSSPSSVVVLGHASAIPPQEKDLDGWMEKVMQRRMNSSHDGPAGFLPRPSHRPQHHIVISSFTTHLI